MKHESSRHQGVPLIIHVVNVGALLLGSLILLLTAVVKANQLVVLLPVLLAAVLYWRLRANPRVAAGYFGLSMVLFGWILICENIVTIDNALGSQISQSLRLDLRLHSYVDTNLRTRVRKYLASCCDDPLTWHYQPGSLYRTTFDCATCGEPYEVRVDKTGYLNRQPGLMQSDQPIDLFLAGDSVLQGIGMPSVVEWLREQIPLRMWNLSIQAYGPRQKINALITYALPKRPQWLIVEFYAGNDLAEEFRNDVCESSGNFHCRYNALEVRSRLAQHPVYRTIFEVDAVSKDIFAMFADVSAHNLTLATTRYLIGALKGAIKAGGDAPVPGLEEEEGIADVVPTVGGPPSRVSQDQQLAYLKTGMALTQASYERLVAKMEGMEFRPTVILLYNPNPYEIYRDIWVKPNPEADQTSAFQREALSGFAHLHSWYFLDLTEPLRQEVRDRQMWLYGQYDRSHWSSQGTAVVADVLAAELSKIIGP
jgi:hypothetical protein